jgi:formamidopyrimidine-DNA glycosylase
VATPSPAQFVKRIKGQTIEEVTRRAKYLVFGLSQDTLLIHLKMSGDLQVLPADAPYDKHAHTIFHFTDGHALRFSDTRKFGRVYLVGRAEEVTGHLGLEPLDASFTPKVFGEILHSHHRQIKPLLLDQTVVVGVGNIYSDESLHRAKIHPQRLSDSLTDAEVKALWRSIRHTLNLAIKHNGSSIDWMYRGGEHQHHFRAYGRTGLPCPVCGTPIRRILVGQRSTHFCPYCQKL